MLTIFSGQKHYERPATYTIGRRHKKANMIYATAFRYEADVYMFCSCFFVFCFFSVHQNYETTVRGND